jgi:hypothetical protein
MGTLFETIAASHEVPLKEVRVRLGRRVLSVDLAIAGVFAAFYVLATMVITRRLGIRYSRDRPLTSLTTILAASVPASAVGVAAGELWALLAEGYRVSSNNHMSYRGARIPWMHHRSAIFTVGLIVFWVIASRTAGEDSNQKGTDL